MRYQFTFPFRNADYKATALFSFIDEPYFLSTTLLSEELVKEFGESLSIKTDGDKVLLHPEDNAAVIELKTAVFNYLKQTPAFMQLKAKYSSRRKQQRKELKQHKL